MTRSKPRVGDRVDAYHDGKASPSRLVIVTIDETLKRDDLSRKFRNLWRSALKEDFRNAFEGLVWYCDSDLNAIRQFWDWNCTEFLVGHILNDKETEKDPMLFARRLHGDWHSVNWNYSLNVNGCIRRRWLPTWRKCAKEMGQTMKWNAKSGKYDYFDKAGKLVF